MKGKPVLYKTLIVGVIVLFIGVGVQPVIANDVLISKTSDNEEECDICPSIEELVDSKDIEKYQVLLDKIKSFKERNKRLNSDRPPICDILDKIDERFSNFETFTEELLIALLDNGHSILFFIVLIPFLLTWIVMSPFYFVYIYLCIPPP